MYPQSGFELEDGKLILSKIGNIKIILHRDIEGRIKTCTIKRDLDQWYAIFTDKKHGEEPSSCEVNHGRRMVSATNINSIQSGRSWEAS